MSSVKSLPDHQITPHVKMGYRVDQRCRVVEVRGVTELLGEKGVRSWVSKWGSEGYRVDRRCGVMEVKGGAELRR